MNNFVQVCGSLKLNETIGDNMNATGMLQGVHIQSDNLSIHGRFFISLDTTLPLIF